MSVRTRLCISDPLKPIQFQSLRTQVKAKVCNARNSCQHTDVAAEDDEEEDKVEEVAVEAKESKPEQEFVPDEPQLESMAGPWPCMMLT